MNGEYRYYSDGDGEFETALAAAAFTIHSLEDLREPNSSNKNKKKYRTQDSSKIPISNTNPSTKQDAYYRPPKPRRSISRRFSHESANDQEKSLSFSTRRKSVDGKADAWEKSAMAKIRKRYEKLNSAILAWEKEKRLEVNLDMEKKKRELELKIELNSKHYENKLARFNHIAEGARAQREEKRKNEESEVKKRKLMMRSREKLAPFKCFCFSC